MRGSLAMAVKYLLDASAIYPLVLMLRERLLEYLDKLAVLDLTIYEVGNVIWKEFRRGRLRDPSIAARLFEELFKHMTILRPRIDLGAVIEIAVKGDLTFYDASYLYTARTRGIKLVTEDSDLLRFPESINTRQLLKELQT